MKPLTQYMMTLVITVCLMTSAALDRAAAADRPNIILCMADDLGWGDVGFNGNTIIRTPHLDAMAAASLKFNRFYAAAPVCSPTRGSAVTGRHPYRYGIFNANAGHMRPMELTLAELLRVQGYTTGHFGKWHMGTLTTTEPDANRGGPKNAEHFSPPEANGFDVNFSTESKVPTWDPMIKPPRARDGGPWWDPIGPNDPRETYGTYYWSRGQKVTDNLEGDDSRIIMDRAIPFIRDAVTNNQPFFAVVWFHAPHLPVVAGPKHAAMYAQYEKYEQHYYGCITALDEQVGRLRATLREIGAADNTMLWFCADNGPEGQAGKAPGSAAHLRGRKRDLFEGGVRVPGLLEWPAKVRGGSVTEIPAVTSDYLPTILDVLGVPMADSRPIDGVSLLPLIEGRMTQRPRPIGFESRDQVALIDNQYKLIRVGGVAGARKKNRGGKAPSDGYMLFDITADPSEKNDIAADYPRIVKQMTATLEAWRESCRQSLNGKDYP